MKKNFLFIFLIIAILSMVLQGFSSELRMEAMGAKSAIGHYVVPDDWCDTFYINPCFSIFIEKKLINAYSYFGLLKQTDYDPLYSDYNPPMYYKDISESVVINDNYYLKSINNAGIIMPFKKFQFGLKNQLDINYSKFNQYLRYNQYKNKEYYHYKINSNLFFSWLFAPGLAFGFNIGNNTLIADYNKEIFKDSYGKYIEISKIPIDFDFSNNFGFLIKNDLNIISITACFKGGYEQYYPKYFYDNDVDDWSYRIDEILFNTDILFLYELKVTKVVNFRIFSKLGLEFNNSEQVINENNEFSDNDSYHSWNQFTVPISMAFSVYHTVNEKVLLFYGIDLINQIYAHFYKDDKNEEYDLNSLEHDYGLGLFIGGEFNVLKWLTIRTGVTSLIFEHMHYIDKHDFEHNIIRFPLRTDFKIGFAFKPLDFFSIEISSGFLFSGLEYYKFINDENESEEERNFNFSGSIGFVFKF